MKPCVGLCQCELELLAFVCIDSHADPAEDVSLFEYNRLNAPRLPAVCAGSGPNAIVNLIARTALEGRAPCKIGPADIVRVDQVRRAPAEGLIEREAGV